MSKPSQSNTPLIVAVAAVTCFVIAGVVVIAIAVPEGGNPGSLIALLVGILAPTITSLTTLAKVTGVDAQVKDLGNGGMDAKIRAGIADVVDDQLIRPEVRDQLVVDRARRAAGNRRRTGAPIPVDQPGDPLTTGDDLA